MLDLATAPQSFPNRTVSDTSFVLNSDNTSIGLTKHVQQKALHKVTEKGLLRISQERCIIKKENGYAMRAFSLSRESYNNSTGQQ